jgi:hypothetical protein
VAFSRPQKVDHALPRAAVASRVDQAAGLKEEQDEEASAWNRGLAVTALGLAPAWAQEESKREAGMPKQTTTAQITGETERPMVARTYDVLDGTVWWVSGTT